jgi:hypothetical protein
MSRASSSASSSRMKKTAKLLCLQYGDPRDGSSRTAAVAHIGEGGFRPGGRRPIGGCVAGRIPVTSNCVALLALSSPWAPSLSSRLFGTRTYCRMRWRLRRSARCLLSCFLHPFAACRSRSCDGARTFAGPDRCGVACTWDCARDVCARLSHRADHRAVSGRRHRIARGGRFRRGRCGGGDIAGYRYRRLALPSSSPPRLLRSCFLPDHRAVRL